MSHLGLGYMKTIASTEGTPCTPFPHSLGPSFSIGLFTLGEMSGPVVSCSLAKSI